VVEAGVVCAVQHARIDDYSGKGCPKNGTRVPKMNLSDLHPRMGKDCRSRFDSVGNRYIRARVNHELGNVRRVCRKH
jgi:hypothetical protein